MAGNDVRFRTSVQNDASKTFSQLDKQLDSVGLKSKGLTGALGKLSVATGGLVSPQSLAAAGALALGGILVSSVKAAADEQKNIAKLGASLAANIPAWDGNTTAIEKTIAAREKLAFSDSDLRDSLGSLIGVTHDVQKAFEIQATAMDLARFKGISLQEASTALIRIEGGQYRALKSLIGSTKDIKTETQALAAVQKVAGGQAQAYADTSVGSFESVQIALQDVSEEIGHALLPALKELAVFLRDDLVPVVDQGVVPAFHLLGDVWAELPAVGNPGQHFLDEANQKLLEQKDAADKATSSLVPLRDAVKTLPPPLDTATTSFNQIGRAIGRVNLGFKHLTDSLSSYYSVASIRGQEAGLRKNLDDDEAALRKLRKEFREGKIHTKEYHRELDILTGKIADDKQALLDNSLAQSKMGDNKDLTKWIADQRKNWDHLTAAEKKAVAEAEKYVYYLGLARMAAAGGSKAGKAAGGPVFAGMAYTVGEQGPETFVPAVTGTIIPHGGWTVGGNSNAGVTPHSHPIYVSGRKLGDAVDHENYWRSGSVAASGNRT